MKDGKMVPSGMIIGEQLVSPQQSTSLELVTCQQPCNMQLASYGPHHGTVSIMTAAFFDMAAGLLKEALSSAEHSKVLIDGFPRVLDQLGEFEQQVGSILQRAAWY